ncbi:universal stress protein [Natrinema soli]|uniref:Universal stress protein n=1 Tax=Natrinema soli TaxID=1930624 RepID=A0ABD5SUH1_9EURY|nr:universal stress protein [Natrinema soli]
MDGVTPYAEVAAFECPLCGTLSRMPQSYGDLIKPNECAGCENSRPGFRFNREQSELVDLQKIVIIPPDSNLEEPPATIAFLKNDLVDMVGPGDLVTLNGICETFKGQAQEAIGDYATENDIGLVVMASEGESDLASQSLGSVTDRVLRTVDVPVLVVFQ